MEWYPKNPTDYREDTWHLSLAEHGAYNLLIDHYMNTERPLPNNDIALSRIIGISLDEWLSVEVAVIALFKCVSNTLQHKRCDAEIEKSYIKRRDGKVRQKKYRKQLKTKNPVTRLSQVSNASRGEERIGDDRNKNMLIKNERFDAFWLVYPRKVGKKAAKIAYMKAIDKIETDALQCNVIEFAKTITDIKFCAHAATWLNGECWNDNFDHVQPAEKTPASKMKDAFADLRSEAREIEQINNVEFLK